MLIIISQTAAHKGTQNTTNGEYQSSFSHRWRWIFLCCCAFLIIFTSFVETRSHIYSRFSKKSFHWAMHATETFFSSCVMYWNLHWRLAFLWCSGIPFLPWHAAVPPFGYWSAAVCNRSDGAHERVAYPAPSTAPQIIALVQPIALSTGWLAGNPHNEYGAGRMKGRAIKKTERSCHDLSSAAISYCFVVRAQWVNLIECLVTACGI